MIRHRSSVAIVTRRYCLLDDHCLSCHKLLTNSQVSSSSKQILGSLIFRARWEDLASVGYCLEIFLRFLFIGVLYSSNSFDFLILFFFFFFFSSHPLCLVLFFFLLLFLPALRYVLLSRQDVSSSKIVMKGVRMKVATVERKRKRTC